MKYNKTRLDTYYCNSVDLRIKSGCLLLRMVVQMEEQSSSSLASFFTNRVELAQERDNVVSSVLVFVAQVSVAQALAFRILLGQNGHQDREWSCNQSLSARSPNRSGEDGNFASTIEIYDLPVPFKSVSTIAGKESLQSFIQATPLAG